MKSIKQTIILFIVAFSLFSTQCETKQHTTSLSYVYNYEIKLTQDIAEVLFQISNKNNQLTISYQQTESIVSAVKQLTQNYCQHYQLKQNLCNTTLNIIDQQTQTLYKITNHNKKMIFSNFLHKQIIKLQVTNAKNVAHLIDQILKISKDISMVSFEWLPPNDDQLYQSAMKAGVQQGFRLCEQINGQLQRVVRVQEIVDFQVQQFANQEQQEIQEKEQLVQDQDNYTQNLSQEQQKEEKPALQWKFQVLCQLN